MKKIGYIKESEYLTFIQLLDENGVWRNTSKIPKNGNYRIVKIDSSGTPTIREYNVTV